MHKAARHGHIDVCRLIMDKVADKNPADLSGSTPLHVAASCGRTDVCRIILERVDDKIPADQVGRTPLHVAAIGGHIDVCCLILDKVDDKNPAKQFGITPLHVAARWGQTDFCRIILERVPVFFSLNASHCERLLYRTYKKLITTMHINFTSHFAKNKITTILIGKWELFVKSNYQK